MRCTGDQNLSDTQVERRLKNINEFNPNMTTESQRQLLREIETCRNLQIWHDASSISNHGYIVMMVNIYIYILMMSITSYSMKGKHSNDNRKTGIIYHWQM